MASRRNLVPLELAPRAVAGAPATGAWRRGTLVCDAAGALWRCTADGTPGTWRQLADVAPPTPVVEGFSIGDLKPWPAASIPTNWLDCDGAAVSRTVYAALFAAIGTTWGAGDGATTFNLPDFRRRTLVGAGGPASAVLGNTVGSVGGAETHVLSVAEMPSHTHSATVFSTVGAPGPTFGARGQGFQQGTPSTNATGGGQAHNNLPPGAVVRLLIKAA